MSIEYRVYLKKSDADGYTCNGEQVVLQPFLSGHQTTFLVDYLLDLFTLPNQKKNMPNYKKTHKKDKTPLPCLKNKINTNLKNESK